MIAAVAQQLEVTRAGKKARPSGYNLLENRWSQAESKDVQEARKLKGSILLMMDKGLIKNNDKDAMKTLKAAEEIIENG